MTDLGEVVLVADRLLAALDAPLNLPSRALIVTASIGIALSTGPADTAPDLPRFADVALYRANDGGRGRYEAFCFARPLAAAEIGTLRANGLAYEMPTMAALPA